MKSPFPQFFKLASLTLLLLGIASFTGCRSYQLGHPAELPFKTIFVKPAANDSYAPQAQALISSEIRERIIRDGRVELIAKESAADVVLYTTLTEYQRKTGTRAQDDTEIAQDFDLILVAKIALYDQRTGEYLFENRTLSERTTAYAANPYAAGAAQTESLSQFERQAMPRIARDIGRKIADEVLSAW